MNDNNKHKHYDAIVAFANGAQIEGRPTPNSAWSLFSNPTWETDWEYRVKTEKPWKPKEGEKYFYWDILDGNFCIDYRTWKNDAIDNKLYRLHDIFPTEKDARAAIPRVEATLTTDVSTNVGSKVGSELDGKPLTDGEIALVKALREVEILNVYDWRKTTLCLADSDCVYTEDAHIAFCTAYEAEPKENKAIIAALNQIQAEQEANDASPAIR